MNGDWWPNKVGPKFLVIKNKLQTTLKFGSFDLDPLTANVLNDWMGKTFNNKESHFTGVC